MKDIYCLAIESSCDETSMSIIKNGVEEIETVTNTQIDIHKEFGGVVPEIASRSHIENITIVLDELFQRSKMSMKDIDIIGVTYGPGLIGSLMIGLQCAKTISLVTGKPLIPVHHIAGHIYANNLEKRLEFPLIALVVSGGHTDLVYMKEDYSFKRIGSTLDDAVGDAPLLTRQEPSVCLCTWWRSSTRPPAATASWCRSWAASPPWKRSPPS